MKELIKNNKTLYNFYLFLQKFRHMKIIVDMPVGNFDKSIHGKPVIKYPYTIDKDELSRKILFSLSDKKLNFLDFGGGDGKLTYLCGYSKSEFFLPRYNENKKIFEDKFNYYGVDLTQKAENIITGNFCEPGFMEEHENFRDFFDVIYSNNVFEHLNRPWVAIENIYRMLKKGGVCVIIAPFSWRYHEVPGDYFRYTHSAFPSMFKDFGEMEIIESGYDLHQRRINNQGDGTVNDIAPTDKFGAWRESWHVISILKKK
ncbi:MAG: class I SAM-dependent methyltransferase [Bacteroidia bacterium]|nr:class I SAM-dependent methyltransferase [Bacteroidia bacterium]